jgi:hypothetical protein
MSVKGLLLGKAEFETSGGSNLRIIDFCLRVDGLPSAPVLESGNTHPWRVQLDGEGLPTSIYASPDAVDFFVTEIATTRIIFFAADRFAFSLKSTDGSIVGRAHTHFTGRESLDFFQVCSSPDDSRLAIVSTRHVAVFSSSGEVLVDKEVEGLVFNCAWKGSTSLEYQIRRFDEPSPKEETRTLEVP